MSEQESSRSPQAPKSSSPTRAQVANLLEVRRRIKARTPKFERFESWRYVRIHEPWRKPKGVDNHMRLSARGWPHLVKVGYRVPKAVRYLHPSGYRDVLVHNLSELEKLSSDRDAARIGATVGRRKKIEIANRARELGIRVLNGRNLLSPSAKSEGRSGEAGKEKEASAGKSTKKKEEKRRGRK
jgi:large subunit ribosomal protein L32e